MECADSSRMEPAGGDFGKLVEKWNSMTQPMFCRALFRYKEFSNPGVVCSDSWTSVSMISAQGPHLRWNNSFSGWKVQLRWEQISDVLWATQRNPDPPDSILYSGCEFEQATSSPSVSNWSPGTYPWTCGEGSMQWELRDQIGSSQRVSVNGGNIALVLWSGITWKCVSCLSLLLRDVSETSNCSRNPRTSFSFSFFHLALT